METENSLTCCWVEDDSPCGESAEVYRNFPVCEVHQLSVLKMFQESRRSLALQAAPYHDIDQFPGLCYIILLPDGCVKIGYSNTQKLLDERFKSLGRDYKAPVVPLAVLSGGFVREAVLHDMFDKYRLPGKGERFSYSPAMAEYISNQHKSRDVFS